MQIHALEHPRHSCYPATPPCTLYRYSLRVLTRRASSPALLHWATEAQVMATSFALRGYAGHRNAIISRLLRRHAHTKCRANNSQLSPIPWLERAALLKPNTTAVKYGDDVAFTYSELMVRWKQVRVGGCRAAVVVNPTKSGVLLFLMLDTSRSPTGT